MQDIPSFTPAQGATQAPLADGFAGSTRGVRTAIGAAIGVAFGSTPFFSAAWALLGISWTGAFGWTARDLATGATLYLGAQTAAFPISGWLLDRLGSRRVACASIVLFGLLLIGLSRMTGSLTVFYALSGLLGLTSAATNFVAYARPVSTWFDRRRGLAIGLVASSQAIGLMMIPLLTRKLSGKWNWEAPLVALGCFELFVCLPAVWLLVKERSAAVSVRARLKGSGPPIGSFLHNTVFWRILACIALEGLAIYAILPNTAFILGRTAGFGSERIAGIISLAGAAFLVGRVGFGFLLDRMQARWLFLALLALLAIGLLLYAFAGTLGGVRRRTDGFDALRRQPVFRHTVGLHRVRAAAARLLCQRGNWSSPVRVRVGGDRRSGHPGRTGRLADRSRCDLRHPW